MGCTPSKVDIVIEKVATDDDDDDDNDDDYDEAKEYCDQVRDQSEKVGIVGFMVCHSPETVSHVVMDSQIIDGNLHPGFSMYFSTDLINHYKDSMRELHGLEVTDKSAYLHLRCISQLYFELKIKNPKLLAMTSDILVEEGILEMFVKFWDQYHATRENTDDYYSDFSAIEYMNFYQLKVILQNYSDKGKEIASACVNNGDVIDRIVQEFSFPRLDVSTVSDEDDTGSDILYSNFGILFNFVRHANANKAHVRKNNGIDKILAYTESKVLITKALAFIVLAYCIDEDENSKIMADYGVIAFLLLMLQSGLSTQEHVSEFYPFSVEETLSAFNKLASNDDNKKDIVEGGLLPMLTTLLLDKNSTSSEHLECVNCLWSLAFHKDNKAKIIDEKGLLERVKKLRKINGISDGLKHAIEGLMFVLGLEQKRTGNNTKGKGKKRYIMLSYKWEVQDIMLKLKDRLSSYGYEIWMDVDKMHDFLLGAMAEAVENSALVVVAVTESYMYSNSCRTEANYAYEREVPILPLLLQPGYKAEGWLGAMIAGRKYVALTSDNFEQKVSDILQEIQSQTDLAEKKGSETIVPHITPPHKLSLEPAQSSMTAVGVNGMTLANTVLPCETWSESDVKSWCSKVGIKDFEDCDGTVLSQLCKLLLRSPDTYYRILSEKLHLNFKDMLVVTKSVECLMKE